MICKDVSHVPSDGKQYPLSNRRNNRFLSDFSHLPMQGCFKFSGVLNHVRLSEMKVAGHCGINSSQS